jgi:hypothetical protein
LKCGFIILELKLFLSLFMLKANWQTLCTSVTYYWDIFYMSPSGNFVCAFCDQWYFHHLYWISFNCTPEVTTW